MHTRYEDMLPCQRQTLSIPAPISRSGCLSVDLLRGQALSYTGCIGYLDNRKALHNKFAGLSMQERGVLTVLR